MELSGREQAELRAEIDASDTPTDVAVRARMVLLRADGLTRGAVAKQCGVSLQTVDRWVSRCAEQGLAGLAGRSCGRAQVPDDVRRRVVELAASSPPAVSGLAGWTVRALAGYLREFEGVSVSSSYVATVLREAGVSLVSSVRKARRARHGDDLVVEHQFVVVEEPYAQALQERQTKAIRDVLEWLRDHRQEQ